MNISFASFCKVLIQLLCRWELLPWKMYLKVVIRWNIVAYPKADHVFTRRTYRRRDIR